MGDFDKKPAGGSASDAAAKEKKKLVFVGVLAAVLVGILGYHFMSGGPQIAAAAGGGDPNSLVPAAMTPAQAIASFDPDPTSKLLLGNETLPQELADVPHNPFKFSAELEKQVVKPPEPPKLAPKPIVVDPVLPPVKQPEAPAINPDTMKLTAILQTGTTLYASLNGNLVTIGSVIGDAKIIDITLDKVVLRHKDYPGGPLTVIKLNTKKFGE